ncbi:DUF4082 domain-containing protein [Actinocrispum wychmicini]|uniref:Ig-like domain-containing protein n=1 Tax=Actinocrispum wychmicini TaxID=1213861 RepID=A0A4R2JXA7_9PSEU|nr:DUF4082 domain-containing protein [Actinocrispum wychmicini]TCO65143.1 Ig-like domain-containing protein [Actinocrispum wychmicini]
MRVFGIHLRRRVAQLASIAMVAANLAVVGALTGPAAVAAGGPCDAPVNKIACENDSHVDQESDQWQVDAYDDSIVGYADDISYAPGNTVKFKVKTDATQWQVNIYRLGYYHGKGARLMQSINRTGAATQNACQEDSVTGLVDCGNWNTTFTWTVPSDATSGLYYTVLHREYSDGSVGESEVVFVVRDDSSHADILFQTSDATWQAYNTYGNRNSEPKGQSLYSGNGPGNGGSAYKVSYNRPILGGNNENYIFNAEVPMLKFLESNGYDMSYTTDVDTARRGNLIANHKVFMPVGHDEYWSNEQRTNVEAARAAGVNLAFMTGNDIFWKTRWETSPADPAHANWRVMVCYKETKPDQVDPNPTVWTGTWRDPRQSPPKDGGRPENSLLGNLFTVNGRRDDRLNVPAAYGKLRLWRNTGVDNLNPGDVKVFQPGTLGYEWNSVEDNGFQPAGVSQLSRTTVAMTDTSQGSFVLQNYGDVYGAGTKTHALTLYKYQPSGALVFGAGTVQWSWGLENDHLFATGTPTADRAMQQATVNLLADMDNVQPRTLRTDLGLTLATMTADVTAPAPVFSAPASPVVGTPYTFSGTVTDVGGKVAGVEVSIDGTTWHAANWGPGSPTWTYTFTPSASGQRTLSVRAVDDSANLSAPVNATVTVVARQCPCSIWTDTSVPGTPATTDTSALELGVKFTASSDGYIRGVRFYKGTGNTGTHTGSLWSSNGTLMATGTFTGETASGWQTLMFPSSVPVNANTTYVASYHTNTGHYAADSGYFTNSATGLEPLTALQSTAQNPNGMYKVGTSGFPDRSFGDSNYWVDVVYGFDPGPDTRAPQLVSTNPVSNSGSVGLSAAPTVSFDEAIAPSSVQYTASGPGGSVAGTASLSSDGKTATFTPSQPWAAGTTYTMSVRASDPAGNSISNPPYTWSFTTGTARPATCPCTVWDDFTTPQQPSSDDPGAVEVGTKVRFDTRGSVLGVRFYKGPGNTGTHTGSLWSSTGTRLATGTFSNENGGGWQTLMFSSPVVVQPNTTYVVSYYAPNGNYAVNGGYFNGVGGDYGALHALAGGVDGANGLYRYGSGGGFPTSSYGSSNYWVDVIWQGGANGDSTPPSVTSASPAANATGVSLTTTVTATYNEPVDLTTAQFTLADPGGAKLAGALSLSTDKKTVTLTPSARLVAGTVYTASIKIADVNGNVTPTATTWSFTANATQTCPCSLFSAATVPTTPSANDTGNYEMGVRFTTSVNGFVTGVKFYKGTGNTGTHTGTLWTNTGGPLATGTFTGETATGWQTLTFATPVAVVAGQPYVVSYTNPNGHYAADNGYFQNPVTSNPLSAPANGVGTANGVYHVGPGFPEQTYQGANYWVDVVFTP